MTPLSPGLGHTAQARETPINTREKRDKHPHLFLFEQITKEEQAAFVKALKARTNERSET